MAAVHLLLHSTVPPRTLFVNVGMFKTCLHLERVCIIAGILEKLTSFLFLQKFRNSLQSSFSSDQALNGCAADSVFDTAAEGW
jgi:positive regulator of sigma E activity